MANVEKTSISQDVLTHYIEQNINLIKTLQESNISITRLVESNTSLTQQIIELSQWVLELRNGLETTTRKCIKKELEINYSDSKEDIIPSHGDEFVESNIIDELNKFDESIEEQEIQINTQIVDSEHLNDSLHMAEKIVEKVYTVEEEINTFYYNCKGNDKIKQLCIIDTDTIESFIQSCHTKEKLKKIYELILNDIKHNDVDDEWDSILDGFIIIYNHQNNTNLIRQVVSKFDPYDRNKHASINGQSNNGDLIKMVIFKGIVDSKTSAVFGDCRSRITTI